MNNDDYDMLNVPYSYIYKKLNNSEYFSELSGKPKPMAKFKKEKAKKEHKKSRGIKHGVRKKK